MKLAVPSFLLLCVLFACCAARAADPQAYKVELAPVGNDDIDQTLKATSDLISLRASAPVSPFGLIARARSDSDRLKTALESFGYYESKAVVHINGILLTDPSLGDTLTALPKGSTAQVAVSFTLGTLYHLRRIDIDTEGEVPLDAREPLGLKSGQPAVPSAALAGGARRRAPPRAEGAGLCLRAVRFADCLRGSRCAGARLEFSRGRRPQSEDRRDSHRGFEARTRAVAAQKAAAAPRRCLQAVCG